MLINTDAPLKTGFLSSENKLPWRTKNNDMIQNFLCQNFLKIYFCEYEIN